MKDDFDNEMGLPDEELAGESSGDLGEPLLGGLESETDVIIIEAAGRPSGGARARSSGGAARPAKKAAPKAAKKAAPKAAKKSRFSSA